MTLQEILKSQGLTDEQVETVTGEMKQNKIFTSSEENLDVRYGKLKTQHESLTSQHSEAQKLIEQLKQDAGNAAAAQEKIGTYEATIQTLQNQLKDTKREAAIKVALIGAHASDVEYMAFKLKEQGEIELDESGNIKGISDKLADLKTQFPQHFEATEQQREMQVKKLDKGDNGTTITKEQFAKMSYKDRLALHAESPEAYAELAK